MYKYVGIYDVYVVYLKSMLFAFLEFLQLWIEVNRFLRGSQMPSNIFGGILSWYVTLDPTWTTPLGPPWGP